MNIWDEARVFIGNHLFHTGVKTPVFEGKMVMSEGT